MKSKRDLLLGITPYRLLAVVLLLFLVIGKIPYSEKILRFIRKEKINIIYEINQIQEKNDDSTMPVYKANGFFMEADGNLILLRRVDTPYEKYTNDDFIVYKDYGREFIVYNNDPNKVYYKNVLVWDNDTPLVDDLDDIVPSLMNADYMKYVVVKDKLKVYSEPDKNSEVICKVDTGYESRSFKNGMYNDEFWTEIYLEESDTYGWICGSENITIIEN